MIIDPRIVPDAHDSGLTLEEIADCCGCGRDAASRLLIASGRKVRRRGPARDLAARRRIVVLVTGGTMDVTWLAKQVGRSERFVGTFLRRWLDGVEVLGGGEG